MRNFDLLQHFAGLTEPAVRAEVSALTDPRTACFYARRALELMVDWIYDNDKEFDRPYETHLAALLAAPCCRDHVPTAIVAKMRIIKELGNAAVHGRGQVWQNDGLVAVRELFHVGYWFARSYSKNWTQEGATFDPALVPQGQSARLKESVTKATEALQKAETDLRAKDAELVAERERRIDSTALAADLEQLRAAIAEARRQADRRPDHHDYNEAQTRDYFTDLMLREAGWGVNGWKDGEDIEFEVEGMPPDRSRHGKGYVDYVLWGDDGRPLGLVEAKRTKRDARDGQRQAELYANCLDQQFGRRPIIFFTNGYETWLWDDAFYPPRSVQGFLKKDELSLLIDRRTSRSDPAAASINSVIVERYYHHEAIREIGKRLNSRHRKALIVMATGAGKTRAVVALVDLLQRCNWIKRTLFLADRQALVRQAVNAFKSFLPGSSPVNLLEDKHGVGRVYVSTYPTILNLIEVARIGGDAREFGVGHFDPVVNAEAHRSVYQKYRTISSTSIRC